MNDVSASARSGPCFPKTGSGTSVAWVPPNQPLADIEAADVTVSNIDRPASFCDAGAYQRSLILKTKLLPAILACVAANAVLASTARGDMVAGREVYVQVCAACHTNGVAGAPRFGNRAEWEPRLLAGRNEMMRSVLKGKGSMPPKGGNASVSDAQAAAAMEYMLAGAK
jgi:cytochrome c5